MLHKIGGLPAHPLIVHLPIILGPIIGLLAIALLVPGWRDKLIKPTAALAVVGAIAAFAAVESGEYFANVLRVGNDIHEHQEAAETFRNLAFVLALVLVIAAAMWARLKGVAQHVVMVVVALLGLGSIVFVVKTGHEGAKQVWQEEFNNALKGAVEDGE